MHSPSALTEHVSPNLAGFFLLDPVYLGTSKIDRTTLMPGFHCIAAPLTLSPPARGCQSSLVNKARNDAGMTDIGGKMFGNLTCPLSRRTDLMGGKKEAEERHKSQSRMPLEVYMLCFLSGSGCLFWGHCLTQFPRFGPDRRRMCGENTAATKQCLFITASQNAH